MRPATTPYWILLGVVLENDLLVTNTARGLPIDVEVPHPVGREDELSAVRGPRGETSSAGSKVTRVRTPREMSNTQMFLVLTAESSTVTAARRPSGESTMSP